MTLLETYDGFHGQGSEDASSLVCNYKGSPIDSFSLSDQLTNDLTCGSDSLIVGELVRQEFRPDVVFLNYAVRADVEKVPGHVSSLRLSASNYLIGKLFPQTKPLGPDAHGVLAGAKYLTNINERRGNRCSTSSAREMRS